MRPHPLIGAAACITGLVWLFGAVEQARAEIIIDFETFPNSDIVPAGAEITDQYSSLGVIFGSVPIPGATQVTNVLGLIPTSSPFKSLAPNGSAPFNGGTLILNFLTPVTSVGSFFIDDQLPVEVTAFDADSNIVGGASSDGTNVGFDSWQIDHAPGITVVEMAGGFFPDVPTPRPDGWAIDDLQFSPIPEPSALTLAGIGTLALIGYGWRRLSKS